MQRATRRNIAPGRGLPASESLHSHLMTPIRKWVQVVVSTRWNHSLTGDESLSVVMLGLRHELLGAAAQQFRVARRSLGIARRLNRPHPATATLVSV